MDGNEPTNDADFSEQFDEPMLHPRWAWFCDPPIWSIDTAEGCLRLETAAGTDFWQRTHYGFQADNGHFLYTPLAGDWTLSADVRFQPVHQYDQAGLMVRLSADCWLKTSVEYEPNGPSRLGAVVTNGGYSDWSTQDFPSDRREVRLRVRREANDYLVEWSPSGLAWSQLRVTRLLADDGHGGPIHAGVYACSPKGVGYEVEFRNIRVEPGRMH